MSVHQYTAGARTRNVVNIADVGGTSAAYSLQAANSDPSLATDGFKNFRSQKTLHVLIHNNNLNEGGSASTVQANKITIWVYKSSLGGLASWSPLRIPIFNNTSAVLQFPTVVVPDTIAQGGKYHMVLPIEGAERIAVRLGSSPFNNTADGGSLDIYLGVNSI